MNIVISTKHRATSTRMRVREALALTLPAIDSQYMFLRAEQGKGLRSPLPFITTGTHVLRICRLNSRTEILAEVIQRSSLRG
jgi:hypothetical protein